MAHSPDTPDLNAVDNGVVSLIDGKLCVHYDGYWIRYYEVPMNEDKARKELIDTLTKRVFHHTEPGINTPGMKLAEARAAYDRAEDPVKRRVNAAMLAGALLNRGSDIFGVIINLRQRGIEVTTNNELFLECESCFIEAMDLGKQVKHYSGEEGLDELWGEPLKAFSMPVAEFYESRYIKIAQTMRAIDRIGENLISVFADICGFDGVEALARNYAEAAKKEIETMKTDAAIFDVWPEFVAAGDALWDFHASEIPPSLPAPLVDRALDLLREGKKLIEWIAFARVPMPKTTQNFIAKCGEFSALLEENCAA
ncbi:MAG: hypothetical protein ACU84Q_17995 [Gammaproteobacteria bacterium]